MDDAETTTHPTHREIAEHLSAAIQLALAADARADAAEARAVEAERNADQSEAVIQQALAQWELARPYLGHWPTCNAGSGAVCICGFDTVRTELGV